MKKILIILILSQIAIFAQYNNEATTEESFEESNIYFQSHYLNPYAIQNFDKVTPGLINNPFLNLYINPANLPKLDTSNALVYLDFRGDRTEPKVVQTYVVPLYYSNIYYPPQPDPRLISQARTEPEPIFSFGILSYPLKNITDKFMLGGTYQLIQKSEKYYTMPYWIYQPNYYLDAFNVRANVSSSVPVQPRYAGKDEMTNEIHLFSLFAGYRFTDDLSAGISVEGVFQNRSGGYLNLNNSEYGSTSNYTYSNLQSSDKSEKYHHIDLSAGVEYNFMQKILLGLRGGILHGNADQNYSTGSGYFYQYNDPNTGSNWSINNSNSSTVQSWNHNGDTKYIGFNFSGNRNNSKVFSGYYKYTWSDISLSSTSTIFDTSNYSSFYTYNSDTSRYSYNSYTYDNRTGRGLRTVKIHELLLNYKSKVTSHVTVQVGVYFNSTVTKINDTEPVTAARYSANSSIYTNQSQNYSYMNYLFENKQLSWDYNSTYWTLQIPVVINFDISRYWSIMLGLNRILDNWDITDQTLAYFNERQRIENGTSKTEKNFIESYTQPEKKITEDRVKIFTSFQVNLSHAYRVRLLIDPEFGGEFLSIQQWWLSFEAEI